ncbi:trypsin-like serine protease [Vibrio scophthalmi]|uniref:U-plasminogen activator n=1 Tax=Vibrio scophthalmi TaxID=45658 RepID=A0A1C7FHG6_9VIBR|nr:trypsin-like serine protease [Vibrio scophthalmi]ANU38794.1 U-plasminogen activator [Vibrio scophthalmi]
MRKLILVTALALSHYAHSVEVSPYIINGSSVDINNYPSFASLFYEDLAGAHSTSFCGATVLNSEYVLTAAHCIVGNANLDKVTVVSQLVDETNYVAGAPIRVSDFFVSETYIDSSSQLWPDDIAILKLETPLATSDFLDNLNFSYQGDFPADERYVTIGHGLVYNSLEGEYQNENELLETTLRPLTVNQCRAIWGSNFTDKQICFDGVLPDGILQNAPCDGDSGGPVYWFTNGNYVQVGITSFGLAKCGDGALNSQVTSAFTNVARYENWIKSVLSGTVSAKYSVVTTNGQRILVDPSSPTAISPTSSDSSGGNVSVISLLGLLFISLMRHCSRVHMSCSSNHLRSQN